jgi:hypothetical protein
MPRALPVCFLVTLSVLFSSCGRPPASEKHSGARADVPASSLLTTLHAAALEMALDGFQFNKPALGWPCDAGAKSGKDYINLLLEYHYIDAAAAKLAEPVIVANTAEPDPMETALFKIRSPDGTENTVRKDGKMEPSAPGPPREPEWLP